MIYPKRTEDNLRFRAEIFEQAEKDPNYAAIVRELCSRDVLFFFNVFCWAYDPLRFPDTKYRPVITYSFQDKTILELNRCIDKGENIVLEKSRDMLASYMVIYSYLWRWLFKPGEDFKIGSNKQEQVDKQGDMGTHFEKLRYQLRVLPYWLLPKGFDIKKHSPFMRLINPENQSIIVGEATNADFGRGDRKKSIFYDEFEAWEIAQEAWDVGSDVTRCKIAVGTHKGMGTAFYSLVKGEEVKNKIRLMWYLHPQKCFSTPEYFERVKAEKVEVKGKKIRWNADQSEAVKLMGELADWERDNIGSGLYVDQDGKIRSEWYDNEVAIRTAEDVSENLDCNPMGSGTAVFDLNICELNRRRSQEPVATGNLMWKVRPVWNSFGEVENKEQLDVEFIPNPNGLVRIWEYPNPEWEHGYCGGVDTSEGLEQSDYDVATILRRFDEGVSGKPKTAARLRGRIRLNEYPEELAKLGTYYNRCFLNIERNNHGHAVIIPLFRMYPWLWHQDVFASGIPKITDKIGFQTGEGSKNIILAGLGKAIAYDEWIDLDSVFWGETLTFVETDGKKEAQGKSKGQRCYDDTIMSTAIALWTNSRLPLPKKVRQKPQPLKGWRARQQNTDSRLIRFTV